MSHRILISPSSFGEFDDSPIFLLKQSNIGFVSNPYGRKLQHQELLELLPGKSGIIAGVETLDKSVMDNSHLKVISRCGSGLDNVDLEYAKKLGIHVFNTPDAPVDAVAEMTVSAILSVLRNLHTVSSDMRWGIWKKRIGCSIKNKNVVIVGFGRIGRKVAEILYFLGAKIIAVDPFLRNKEDWYDCLSLQDALGRGDLFSVHVSGNDCVLGNDEFQAMKDGVFIFNASRGGAVNEHALIKALETKKVAGAWIDVFEEEPYSGKLIEFSNVLLSPHMSSYTRECRVDMEVQAVQNLLKCFRELNTIKLS